MFHAHHVCNIGLNRHGNNIAFASPSLSPFLKAGLYDQFYWFKASHDIDENGLDAIAHFDIKNIEKQTTLKHAQTIQLDDDVLAVYKI